MERDEPSADVIDTYLRQWKALLPNLPTVGIAISGRIVRIVALYRQLITPVLSRYELEEWEYDVLATLRRSASPEGSTMSELTAHMLLAPGSTTHRVEQLVRRKLVTRRQDPENRRRVLVSLTAEGRARIDALLPELAEVLAAPVVRLDRRQREELTRAIKTLLKGLETAVSEYEPVAMEAPDTQRKQQRSNSKRLR